MPGRDNDRMLPCVVGEGDEAGGVFHRIGGKADIGLALQQNGGDVARARLIERQAHMRESLLEARDDWAAAYSAPAYAW